MLVIFILLSAGICFGYLFRKKRLLIRFSEFAMDWAIYLLLFFLGLTAASNEKILSNINRLGLLIIILTIGSLLGSVIAGLFIYKYFFKGKNEE